MNFTKHLLLILVSTVTGCISISAFASLNCIPVSIVGSAAAIVLLIPEENKIYKSIIRRKERENLALFVNYKLNIAEVLISEVLID